MYLKSIEVQGFKSFANKIVFDFHNGITGIVGPNGSGKSNVADAVRWVLGEQSAKQLRGAKMEDVIFAGTQNRKPVGFAYVAITLDNSDHALPVEYDEVTVSRRVYRSGESEYKINGHTCRLKDVTEMFYDTGIGKEGYSIIGQGQIDKILSGKPEERRELFDEAAGIVKFKRRKAAAIKKLDNERNNLVRVNDILSELEKQVGPLQVQSEKAKEYLNLKSDLKKYDVNAFLLETDRIRKEIAELDNKIEIADNDLAGSRNEYDATKAEYEEAENQLNELNLTIEQTNQVSSALELDNQKFKGEINLFEEQVKTFNANKQLHSERINDIEKDKTAKTASINELKKQAEAINTEINEYNTKLNAINEEAEAVKAEIDGISGQIENRQTLIYDNLTEQSSIKAENQKFITMLEQLEIRKSQLNSRIITGKSDETAQRQVIASITSQLKECDVNISSINASIAQANANVTSIKGVITEKTQELDKLTQNYHRSKSRLESLVNITERYDGYGNSIRKIMELKDSNPGILGVIADIIKVEKQYETAIETALGGTIQNIVTDKENTAKELINYLKVNKLGRATFLPLNAIHSRNTLENDNCINEKGVVGVASNLVRVSFEYEGLAKYLLGRILVVDNIENALVIARKYKYSLRIVTLEGEYLNVGGSISGGAFKNNSNLLGRRREMDELEKKVKKLSEDITTYNQKIEDTKSKRNKLRMDLEALKTEMQRKSIEQNTARLNISQARERMEEEAESAQSLKLEEQEIETKIFEIRSSKETIVQELAASEELEKTTQEQILVFQKELEGCRLEESEASAHAGEWEVKVEKMRQALDYKQANVDRIGGELERAQAELNEILQALTENAQEVERKKNNILEIEKTIAASHENQDASKKKLDEDIAKKEELSAKQKGFFQSREEMSERMNALDKEVYRLSEQKKKLEDNIEGQINYMWDEYEITLSDAAGLRNEEMNDLPAMKREISGLKDEIRKLGNVNVNAIEDYRNLMERYTFMKTQHDDLVEAEKTLEGIIEELDTAMRKQFTEKFAEISREFDKVFKELFGGGKGTLELMEDEDILEAGIRIIAQPPGKKLQNMMQLSGGEKALSAISLLFAIQNLKPSPFCLLDEIEAALDDSNVGRFAKYLHKLTKNTQFIVITHRRGTMEQVDRLYGITMQEKGVSTLVSVNLIDKDLDD